MYFYIHKIKNNENEQAQLLEMRSYAGFCAGNGKGLCGIGNYKYIIGKLRRITSATFSF
jgi:hypothetical protein